MAHVVVLTGAGVSKESGIPTFRDDGTGLWMNHKIEEIATPRGWMQNTEKAHAFYQARRRQLAETDEQGERKIRPNAAHYALVQLEEELNKLGHDFTLITQNIDGLHLEAGSENVIEMHGKLRTLFCQRCHHEVEGFEELGDELIECPNCPESYLRPDVVWFEEMPHFPHEYEAAVQSATHFISVGTSAQVWPAAGFVMDAFRNGAKIYHVNVEEDSMMNELHAKNFLGPATEVMHDAVKQVLHDIESPDDRPMKHEQHIPQRIPIEGFLTNAECTFFIGMAEEMGMEEATITTPEGHEKRPDYRNNDRLMFDSKDLAERLGERLKPYLDEYDPNWEYVGLNERFKIYKYSPGQSFKMHSDASYERSENEKSFQTILINLNEGFDGGETEFFGIETLSPKTGMATVFFHHLMHQGNEVTDGVKYALRTDVMYRRKNEADEGS